MNVQVFFTRIAIIKTLFLLLMVDFYIGDEAVDRANYATKVM